MERSPYFQGEFKKGVVKASGYTPGVFLIDIGRMVNNSVKRLLGEALITFLLEELKGFDFQGRENYSLFPQKGLGEIIRGLTLGSFPKPSKFLKEGGLI